MLVAVGVIALPVAAAQPPVNLATATPFAVLASSTITNTGPSVISGDVGLWAGTSITGLLASQVSNGSIHDTDAVAQQAQSDLTTAYLDAQGRTPFTVVTSDLGGQTLDAGVYHASSSMSLTGSVTLDGQGDAGAVFIFQAGSTLITASNSTVSLIDGAQACNVFWQVGSSATLGTGTNFVGSIMALASDTLDAGANVTGQVLASTGAVTLDDNTITTSACASTTGGGTTTSTTAPTTSTTSPGSTTATTSPGSTTATTSPGSTTATTSPGSTTGTTVPAISTATTVPDTTSTTAAPASAVVPVGAPQTGAGGASKSDDPTLVVLGGLALVGAAATAGNALRRRRSGRPTGGSTGGE